MAAMTECDLTDIQDKIDNLTETFEEALLDALYAILDELEKVK